ncbi:MAG: cbb3-type cytochrome c oxidase subunit I [Deltaproteobacteria bacterium]|nr:cbb3-type cytochrome c oxidase subunit I [Deltaproteobacteria bacterium]
MNYKYESQRVAYPFFIAAMLLFAGQIIFGLIIGAQYIWPDLLFPAIPFNIARMIHINLLVVWLIFGFMGSAYYLLPEECEGEIYSVKLALLQFWLFLIGGATAIVGYLFRWHDGREFLEQPTLIKVAIVIVVLMFIFNMIMTLIKGRKWTSISTVLLIGFLGLAVFYLFAFFKPANMVVDKYYWWFVVHLWVEGVWELIMAALLSFLLLKLTGIDREVAEKWLYVIVGLTFLTGIIGTGHHYYWIGTPAFWQTWGAYFSAFEMLPFAAMVAFSFKMVSKRTRSHPNRAAILWTVGASVLSFIGAGLWGFMHTLPQINYYTHGTQVTASHGHMAFFGAYAVIVLAMASYAVPNLRKLRPTHQKAEILAFWTMCVSMMFITLSLTGAGIVQVYLQRVLGMPYMETQSHMVLFYGLRLIFGATFAIGLGIYLYDFFFPCKGGECRSDA